jgi:5-methylcytosine-specific restriction endonuclease McrA
VSEARKRLDSMLEEMAAQGEDFGPRHLTDDEIDAKHAEIRRRIELDEAMTPGQQRYADWLKTPRWITLRNQRLHLDGYVCQGCGGTAVTAHHIWYPEAQHLDLTPLWTLVSLCAECHKQAHRIYRRGSVPWPIHDDDHE